MPKAVEHNCPKDSLCDLCDERGCDSCFKWARNNYYCANCYKVITVGRLVVEMFEILQEEEKENSSL
jgi:hypothetical protein